MLPTKVLYLILNKAVPESVATYKDEYKARLKTQKFMYLFDQIWGEDLYNHSWYLAGPYSSTLTRQIYNDLIELPEETRREWEKLSLSDDAQSTIDDVHTLIEKVQKQAAPTLTEEEVYELVASIWYIAKKKKNEEDIKKDLLLNKPHFNKVSNLPEIVRDITHAMRNIA